MYIKIRKSDEQVDGSYVVDVATHDNKAFLTKHMKKNYPGVEIINK